MNSYGLAPTTPSRWRVYQVPPPRHGRGGRIRTHDTRFWRPLLYQTELHPYYTKIINFLKCSKSYISQVNIGKLAQPELPDVMTPIMAKDVKIFIRRFWYIL